MKYLAAAVALTMAMAAGFLWVSPFPKEPETAANMAGNLPGEQDPQASTATSAPDGSEGGRQQGMMTLQELLDLQETEVVFGIDVLKNRNCDVRERYVENGDGTVHREVSCEPRSPQEGPFDQYSNEALAVLAQNDAKAALELGRRLITGNPRTGTRYLLRAVALDTAPVGAPARLSPIWEIVNSRFKTDAVIRSDDTAMKNMHLFYSLGVRLDPEYEFYAAQSRQLLEDAGYTSMEIRAIEDRSGLYYENMERLRMDILGEPLLSEERL